MSEPIGHVHAPPSHIPLGKKIGPAPAWVWGALIVGVVIGYYYLHNRNKTLSTAPVQDGGTGATTDSGAAATPITTSTGTPAQFTSTTGNGLRTNGEWSIQAAQFLVEHGTPAGQASTAIADYLNGHQLTSAESALVSKALTGVGPPPEGVLPVLKSAYNVHHPPPGTVYTRNRNGGAVYQEWPDGTSIHLTPEEYAALGRPKTVDFGTPPGKPKPPVHPHHYRTHAHDTLGGISSRMYGSAGGWGKIRNANRTRLPGNVSASTKLHAGLTLVIPN